ncbi:MAG: hypothetical protein HYZ73_05845, partial [Elusimicrobia bacterium]|nr:hypothetical protein [Elusimicrobiota bacterium]
MNGSVPNPFHWVRPTAAVMAVVVFYTHVLAPPLARASFWEDRRHAVQGLRVTAGGGPVGSPPSSRFDLPWVEEIARAIGPYATIQETHLAPGHNTPLIVHIQDLHGHWEVQRNIAKVIEALQRQRDHSLLVGMEGAAGQSLLDFYRAFPDKALNLDI